MCPICQRRTLAKISSRKSVFDVLSNTISIKLDYDNPFNVNDYGTYVQFVDNITSAVSPLSYALPHQHIYLFQQAT